MKRHRRIVKLLGIAPKFILLFSCREMHILKLFMFFGKANVVTKTAAYFKSPNFQMDQSGQWLPFYQTLTCEAVEGEVWVEATTKEEVPGTAPVAIFAENDVISPSLVDKKIETYSWIVEARVVKLSSDPRCLITKVHSVEDCNVLAL